MRYWVVSYSMKGGYELLMYDSYPAWKRALTVVWDFLCNLTRGWLGGHGLPEAFWEIPLGIPRFDVDQGGRFLVNSFAWKMCELESWVLNKLDVKDDKNLLGSIPITMEQAQLLAPDFVELMK